MADEVKTSTGETTMATVGNAPPQPKPSTTEKYHTPHGLKTLQEIRELLASKHITFGQLGDDALKALGAPPKPVAPVTPPAAKPVPAKIPLTPAATLPTKIAAVVPPLKTQVPLPKSSVAPVAPAKPANPFAPKKS